MNNFSYERVRTVVELRQILHASILVRIFVKRKNNVRFLLRSKSIVRIFVKRTTDPEILKTKKRGRRLLLGDELDNQVKSFVTSIRKSGGVINTAVVKAAGCGVVLSADRSLLLENGGHIEIT